MPAHVCTHTHKYTQNMHTNTETFKPKHINEVVSELYRNLEKWVLKARPEMNCHMRGSSGVVL